MEKTITLKFYGILELKQFWPNSAEVDGKIIYGQSDAVTMKVTIDKRGGFLIQRHPYASCEKTKVYNNTAIIGKVKKTPIDTKGQVTIRLQGIDAPELHYKPDVKNPKIMSQHYSQTAVFELHKFLTKHSMNGKVDCVVKTSVVNPEDAFDCYGRFVGELIIMKDDREFLNVNHWLAEEGLVFPAYYTSMSNGEIRAIQLMVKSAISKKNGIWEFHCPKRIYNIEELATEYRLGKKGRYSPTRDKRTPILMPKVFKRLYKYEVLKNGKSFKAFLANEKPREKCFMADDYLKDENKENNIMNFDNLFSVKGDILFKPWEIVFLEAESKLVNAKTKKVLKNIEF